MTNQKIVRTETAEVLLFDLNQELGEIKIGFRASFCLHKGKLCINETPFLSLNLSPIENIIIDNDTLHLDTQFSKNNVHFIIKPAFPGTKDLMLFIQQLSKKPMPEAASFSNSIYLRVDNGELLLRLEDFKATNRILVTYSNVYGNHIIQRFPEPPKRYKIDSCSLSNNILLAKCKGLNHTPTTPELNTTYKWPLAFQNAQGITNPNKYRFQFLKS